MVSSVWRYFRISSTAGFFTAFCGEFTKLHHAARKGRLELNDIFSLVFGSLSILLIVFAERPLLDSIAFPIGLGIAVYGVFYFIAHDLFTHRRFLPFGSKNKTLLTIRHAHQKHHQTTRKQGIEPFGLFIFNYGKFWRKISDRSEREHPARQAMRERAFRD